MKQLTKSLKYNSFITSFNEVLDNDHSTIKKTVILLHKLDSYGVPKLIKLVVMHQTWYIVPNDIISYSPCIQ